MFCIAGDPPTIPIWLNARVVRLPVGINYNLANVSKLIMNLSKIAFRSIYAVVAFVFALWQVMIYSAFRFTFTGNEGIGVQAFIVIAFWIDIPLAVAAIFWPRVGLIGISANIVLTVAYILGSALVEAHHQMSVGWPGTLPLTLFFAPKLILIGLLALIERDNRISSRRVTASAPLS